MRLLILCFALLPGMMCPLSQPATSQEVPKPSRRPDRKDREKNRPPRIHLEGLQGTDRFDAEQIIREASIIHSLSERLVRARPTTYRFLLDRLDIAGHLVKKWKLGRYRITREEQRTFRVDDRRGAVAKLREIQVVRKEKGWTHLYLARGYFQIPLIPGTRVDGKGLIVLEYEPEGPNHLRTRAWIYFRIDNHILNRLSRMARKIVQQVIGKKCQLFVLAAAEVSERIAKDPQKAFRTLRSIEGIPPEFLEDYRNLILDEK